MRALLLVGLVGCTADPACPPSLRTSYYAEWPGTLAATTLSNGDLVALSCTTLTSMQAGTDVELAVPPRSAPFSLASSGGDDLYVGNRLTDNDVVQLASAHHDGSLAWSVDLGRFKGDVRWTMLAGPQGPVVVGYPSPTSIRRYRAADGALIDEWNEATAPVVGIDPDGQLYVATAATLRAPAWSKTVIGAEATLIAVQPISSGRVAVLGTFAGGPLDLGDRQLVADGASQFVAVLSSSATTEWAYAWPRQESVASTIAEFDGGIAVGDVLTHYVYGPNATFQQWDVSLLGADGFYFGDSNPDADAQRWIGLASTSEPGLWASVSSLAKVAGGTEDPTAGSTQTVKRVDRLDGLTR